MDSMDEPSAGVHDVERAECQHCGRLFATERIGRHQAVCQARKKVGRKPFDSKNQRLAEDADTFPASHRPPLTCLKFCPCEHEYTQSVDCRA